MLKKVGSFIKAHKILIFPLVLLLLLITLTATRISGTSIGVYHSFLYGENSKDPDLLSGTPQAIRSDEWLVNTQVTIAQEKNNYARINDGTDMSLLVDAPYVDWSTIFKPQYFVFFIIPLEYAFAFKWWFMLFVLMISVYTFALKLLPNKVMVAILVSILLTFSPFVFWWYQHGTIAPLAYAFLILLISMSIIDDKKLVIFHKKINIFISRFIKVLTLSYLLVCFALILYPPFQIPIVIVSIFFILGYMLNQLKSFDRKTWIRTIVSFMVAGILGVATTGIFILTRNDAVNTIQNTVYPGKRTVQAGGYDIKQLLATYLQPQLQNKENGNKYIKNQSEDSTFIIQPLFLVIPTVLIYLTLYLQRKKTDYILLGLIFCSVLFLSQLLIPGIDTFTKLFLLDTVPHSRLLIGLGLLSILLMIYISKIYSFNEVRLSKPLAYTLLGYSVVYLIVIWWAGLEIHRLYIDFIPSKKLILFLSSTVVLGLTLFLMNKQRIGLLILAIFTIASVYQVHPLYRGLGPIYNSSIQKGMESVSEKDAVWAAAQDVRIENLPQMAGYRSLTGVQTYPDISFWQDYSEQKSDHIYNRYAHTFLSTNDSSSLILVGPDLFAVSSSCHRKIAQKVDFVLSTTPLNGSCYQLLKTIPYPNTTFYIYKQ